MRESGLEAKVAQLVRRRGGWAIKVTPVSCVGLPDRLVVLPGVVGFLELKSPTGRGRTSPMQALWGRRLEALGVPYLRSSSFEEIAQWVKILEDSVS